MSEQLIAHNFLTTPGFQSGMGRTGSLLVLDIAPGADLVTAVLDCCSAHQITSAVIVSCIGSLQRLSIHNPAPDPGLPTGVGMGGVEVIEGPIQILSGQGFLLQRDAEGPFIHVHLTVIDGVGKVRGGHVERGDNAGLNRLEVALVPVTGMVLWQGPDERTGLPHMSVKPTVDDGHQLAD